MDNLNLRPHDEAEPGALVQLIYRSVSVHGVASALQMSDILAQARGRNAVLGITGALTAVNGDFLQVVEGPRDSIEALLASLNRDPRHRDIAILERRVVAQRAFSDWAMVSPRLIGLEIAQLALLLSVDAQDIDHYIPFLQEAIRRQQALIEAAETPVSARARPGSGAQTSKRNADAGLEPEA